MNLEEYWQENKRFVTTVAIGLIVFLIGTVSINSIWSGERNDVLGERNQLRNRMRKPLFSSGDRREAEAENEALVAALERLQAELEFKPRARFVRDSEKYRTAASQYMRVAADVRDELLPLANRRRLKLDEGLGMPELSPTDEGEIVRYLEALDLVERIVRLAADPDVGVARIPELRVRPDPVFFSKGKAASVERTRVEARLEGTSLALLRWLWRTQRSESGIPLAIEELELSSTSDETDEARIDVTFVIPRLHGDGAEEVDA